jgi:D-3-phosphoglycerate dehydrogenase
MHQALIVIPGFVKSRDLITTLENSGFNVIEKNYGLAGLNKNEDEFCRIVRDVDTLFVTAMDRVTRRIIESANNLKIIAIRSAGSEGTDLKAATDHGIVVTNNPGANRQAVADLTFGLMLDVSRRISLMDRGIRKGEFDKIRVFSMDINTKKLGIIGLGNIGKAVAERAKGFKMDVVYCDIVEYPEFAAQNNIKKVSLNQLLSESDIVSLHVPINETTRNMISSSQIALMKKNAIVINTCRGGVVNERAVYSALVEKKLFGYGTDVFEAEPPNFPELLNLDSVVSTPHIAGVSEDGLYNMAKKSVEKVIGFICEGRLPENILNPDVVAGLRI